MWLIAAGTSSTDLLVHAVRYTNRIIALKTSQLAGAHFYQQG
jgi:hypothetical protein